MSDSKQVYVVSGNVSSKVCGSSINTPDVCYTPEKAQEKAIDQFIGWLRKNDFVSHSTRQNPPTNKDVVNVSRLEQSGTFDEQSVGEMVLDEDGNVSVDDLRAFLAERCTTHYYACSDSCEADYIELRIDKVVPE